MSETTENQANKLPPNSLWKHISKISISQDKPIMLDYWLRFFRKKSSNWCKRKW